MRSLKFAATVVAGLALATAANAGTITVTGGSLNASVTATNASGATTSTAPFTLGNFGSAGTNGLVSINPVQIANSGVISFTPNASAPQAGVYSGNTANVATAPTTSTFLPAGNYLSAEPNDPVTIQFGTAQTAFSLLWGTVDTYNSLILNLFSGNNSVGSLTVTGNNVASAVANGFTADGTTPAFVTINKLQSGTTAVTFDKIVLTSTSSAFEFVPSVQVPEPASLAILGLGLAGIGMVRRRRSRVA